MELTPVFPAPQGARKVLIATDFSAASRAAWYRAIHLCLALHADVELMHVFEYTEVVPGDSGMELLGLEGFYQKSRGDLSNLAKETRKLGLVCHERIVSGLAAPSILEAIQSEPFGFVALGTRGLSGVQRMVFGSTAECVLRQAKCPVFIVGPHVTPNSDAKTSSTGSSAEGAGPIVFATDFHESTSRAIEEAESLCRKTGLPLHCVHVLPTSLEGESHSEIVPHIMKEALDHLAAVAGASDPTPKSVILYGKKIDQALVDYARSQGASLIVLGVRQAPMLTAHLPAHLAYRVIKDAPCPVLTVSFGSGAALHLPTAACL